MEFDYYSVEELKSIFINGKHTESMTVPYNVEDIKEKRFKKKLLNKNQVFILSTRKIKPVHHFKEKQKVSIQGPFLEDTAQCFMNFEFMHKGHRMLGYAFQFI
ncbi:TPA: hypothetical protein ACHFNF_002299 [Enterobacter hormaechei]|uniref:hypothetical protein n=1 Tax=Enterobacter hormaechei TaxID=158836 RepID=UPI002855FD1C|nr:hypothetical protein [Enterobacter hormaechei]